MQLEALALKHKQNLHIHTTYADGKDKPEEIVVEAINRGFDSIGFSVLSARTELQPIFDLVLPFYPPMISIPFSCI